MSFVGDVVSDIFGGGDAAKEARRAADEQAQYQREALEYLKEREAIPQQFREGALTRLGGLYGLEGGEGSQDEMIERVRMSPIYEAIMGTREAGEDAILRSAAATGGLRSGGTSRNLYDLNQRLEERALLEGYDRELQGLSGLANLPSMAREIASGTAGIGQTLAQGRIAGAQARQDAIGQAVGLGGTLGSAAIMFSDANLKDDIKPVGWFNGFPWYEWVWNEAAEKFGLSGHGEGVLAHEMPDDYVTEEHGFKVVDYERIFNG